MRADLWVVGKLIRRRLADVDMLHRGVNSLLGGISLVPQPVQFSSSERISPMRAPILGEESNSEIAALHADKAI